MSHNGTEKKPSRKLVLSTETVRTLSRREAGPFDYKPTSTCRGCASQPCRPLPTYLCG